jgi:hypothetical protein
VETKNLILMYQFIQLLYIYRGRNFSITAVGCEVVLPDQKSVTEVVPKRRINVAEIAPDGRKSKVKVEL